MSEAARKICIKNSKQMTKEDCNKEQLESVANQKSTNEKSQAKTTATLKSVYGKVYLYAFCIFAFAHVLLFYNIMNVLPFYLNTVLKADPLFIGFLYIPLCSLRAVCTIGFSVLYQKIDNIKLLTWLECRMFFTVFPMALQAIFAIGLVYSNSVEGVTTILSLSILAGCTYFSGGLLTVNYEMDPANSPLRLSVINSFGQISGFVGPILMEAITYTPQDTVDYEQVYRQRWERFFWIVAGFPAMGAVAVVVAYFVRKEEWVPWKGRNNVSE